MKDESDGGKTRESMNIKRTIETEEEYNSKRIKRKKRESITI